MLIEDATTSNLDRSGAATEMLTVAQAAHFLRLHPATLYRLVKEGALPCIRLGRLIRIPMSAILGLVRPSAM